MQQGYIKLNIILRYKTFAAALLLAVYAFVATPVQLWHNHASAAKSVSDKTSVQKQAATFSASYTGTNDVNCKTCSHNYSVFINDAVVLPAAPFKALKPGRQYYIFSIPSSPILHFTNKGPPALS